VTTKATVFLLGVLMASMAIAAPSRTVIELGPLKVGKPCPTFGGFTLENEPLSLAKLQKPNKGETATAVVISFFATYCKACKEKLPAIERVVVGLKARGVLIDYGEDAGLAAPFVHAQRLSMPVIPDQFVKIAQRLGIDKTLPRTIVVDRKGDVSAIFDQEGDDFEQALWLAVDKAMKVN